MARNGSGAHSLAAGNPVTAGTDIESAWANSTMSDVSTEITDSLSRSGKGGMLAAFKATDGSAAAPSIAFNNDVDTGMYLAGTNILGLATNGSVKVTISATGVVDFTGNITTSGTIDGRDVAADGGKLDNIEAEADKTDAANVAAAGALMEPSEGTDIKSTGEAGGNKFLRENGDDTCSWQVVPGGGDLLSSNNLSDVGNVLTAQQNLDLEPGVDVQEYELDLDDIAAISHAGDEFIVSVSGTWEGRTPSQVRSTLNVEDASTANPNAIDNVVEDTTPELGGDLDVNLKAIVQDFTAATGNSFVKGETGIINTDGEVFESDASAEATAKGVLVMALESVAAEASGRFALFGYITGLSGLTAGEQVLSETASEIVASSSKPSSSGTIVRIVGYAPTSTTLWFTPDMTYVENR